MADIEAYMDRACCCGHRRGSHAHAVSDESAPKVVCMQCACVAFVDELELELGGNPALNRHLGPGVREKLREAGLETEEPS